MKNNNRLSVAEETAKKEIDIFIKNGECLKNRLGSLERYMDDMAKAKITINVDQTEMTIYYAVTERELASSIRKKFKYDIISEELGDDRGIIRLKVKNKDKILEFIVDR